MTQDMYVYSTFSECSVWGLALRGGGQDLYIYGRLDLPDELTGDTRGRCGWRSGAVARRSDESPLHSRSRSTRASSIPR